MQLKRLLTISLFAAPLFAQTTLTTTTLTAQITAAQQTFSVASGTGITVSPSTMLYVDREAMLVIATNGTISTSITVARGQLGTAASIHAAASTVTFGPPSWFYTQDPQGPCASSTSATPYINVRNAATWSCQSSVWVQQQVTVLATTYKTTGTGVGSIALKDSGDSNTVTRKGVVGTRGTSIVLDEPSTDPDSSFGGVQYFYPLSAGESTSKMIVPVRTVATDRTTRTASATGTCMGQALLPDASPFNTVGATYRVHGSGTYSGATAASTTFGYVVQISTAASCSGSTAILQTAQAATVTGLTTGYWVIDGTLFTLAAGASGAIGGDALASYKIAAGTITSNGASGTIAGVTADTTAATLYINMVATCASCAGITITQNNWVVERMQ